MDYSTSDILTPTQIGSASPGFTWDLGTDTRREAQISEARILADKNRLATQRQLRDLEAAVRAAQLATAERLAAYATSAAARSDRRRRTCASASSSSTSDARRATTC